MAKRTKVENDDILESLVAEQNPDLAATAEPAPAAPADDDAAKPEADAPAAPDAENTVPPIKLVGAATLHTHGAVYVAGKTYVITDPAERARLMRMGLFADA